MEIDSLQTQMKDECVQKGIKMKKDANYGIDVHGLHNRYDTLMMQDDCKFKKTRCLQPRAFPITRNY